MLGMASPIAALFREILDGAHFDIERLELHKHAEGAEAPMGCTVHPNLSFSKSMRSADHGC
jgi:hypothetical protein